MQVEECVKKLKSKGIIDSREILGKGFKSLDAE